MRRVGILIALALAALAGCQNQAQTRAPAIDPLLGDKPLPEKGATAKSEEDAGLTTPPPPPRGGTATPAGLASPAAVTIGSPRPSPPKEPTGPSSSSASPAAGTYEQLQARLKAAGVARQQLRHQGDDVWNFHCTVPDPKNPNIHDNFEDTRPGRDGLAAIEAVLQKIEQKHRE
jgi:hypothetical protein